MARSTDVPARVHGGGCCGSTEARLQWRDRHSTLNHPTSLTQESRQGLRLIRTATPTPKRLRHGCRTRPNTDVHHGFVGLLTPQACLCAQQECLVCGVLVANIEPAVEFIIVRSTMAQILSMIGGQCNCTVGSCQQRANKLVTHPRPCGLEALNVACEESG